MELLGWDVLDHNGRLLGHYEGMNLFDDDDVVAWVISANIRRRHLNQAQKREMLGKLLKVDPSKSNRSIAKAAGVDDKTVGSVRAELEADAEIPHLEKTVGADGVAQAATKKKPKQPEQDQPADIAAEIIPHTGSKENGAAQPVPGSEERRAQDNDRRSCSGARETARKRPSHAARDRGYQLCKPACGLGS